MLSILIPTYNHSIVALVKGVHQQATKAKIPFEILVLDDCSTDLKISIDNERINQLEFCDLQKNQKNIGRTASRNFLASKASYELLLFLDADVLPKYDDFIDRFELHKIKNPKIIFGGVCYTLEKPSKDLILRWKYGHKRETKSVKERNKNSYSIVSSSLLIDKEVFFKNNTSTANTYGLDILFSGNLQKNRVKVKHIDNPVYHLGLEKNSAFLNKSLEAVKSTYLLEKNSQIEKDIRPLQKSYQKLKKWNLITLVNVVLNQFYKVIESNLLSNHPSMVLFDLYRLNYLIELKKNKN